MNKIKHFIINKFLLILNDQLKDEIYRKLWKEYVKEDIIQFNNKLDEELIDLIANAYVYDGEYDCNFSYWDNIENLINKYSQE